MSKVLVLRTCDKDMKSHDDFQWPISGYVEAPDWDPTPKCGGGLHGLLWGEGDYSLLIWKEDAKWLVVSVEEDSIINLKNKVKFPKGEVVHCGNRKEATDYIQANGGFGREIVGAFVISGDRGTPTSGDCGTSTSGDYGTSTCGMWGTSTSRYEGTSISGNGGKSISGNYGKASSGEKGIIQIDWYDKEKDRLRTTIGYIGENGFLPNVMYKCDEKGNLVPVEG